MAGSALARRYARAVFGLAEDAAGQASLLEQVDELTNQIEEDDALHRALFTPLHPRAERSAVLGEIAAKLELSVEVRQFAALLVSENRMQHLPAIRDALRELVERAAGRVDGTITSARPLQPDEVERVRSALSERVGADVQVAVDVDESLIGGLVARVGDLLLDASVRTQLASLAGSLRKGSA